MNLKNEQYGIAIWIKRICPDRDYQNIEVNIGDIKPTIEPQKSKTLRSGHYYLQLEDEIKKINTNLITIVLTLPENEYGISIMKSDQSLFYPKSDESARINGQYISDLVEVFDVKPVPYI